jgi:predicted permease
MSTVRRFTRRLFAVLRHRRAEDDLARDVAAHLRLLEDGFVARGMDAEQARRAARRAFGGVEQAKEAQRDARSFRWLDDARRDVGYAVRSLSRTASVTGAAILTLAVGIGAATAIYSVVDAVLLQPLDLKDPDRLVNVSENQRPRDLPAITYREYLDWRGQTTTLSDIACAAFDPQFMVRTPIGAARLTAGLVCANYFDVLGISASIGRTIVQADEDQPDVAVLSFETWQKYFGGDPAAIGAALPAKAPGNVERMLTVVGVMPKDMPQIGGVFDLYVVPRRSPRAPSGGAGRTVGRLREGVSLADAEAEAQTIGAAVRPPRPPSAPPLNGPRFSVTKLKDDVVSELRPALRVFMVAVGVVLAIVCANVAGLLLARGASRQREFAVRLAIGASRGRIMRQVLTECAVLACVGGVLGALLAAAGVAAVKQLATLETEGVFRIILGANLLPRASEVAVDLRLFAAAFILSAISTALFGLLPALQLSRADNLHAIGSRRAAASGDVRSRHVLVVAQLALATVLLVGAGLLTNSFVKLATVAKGYDPAGVLVFQLAMPDGYARTRVAEVVEEVVARARAMPGVEHAGFAYAGIMVGIQNTVGSFVAPGHALAAIAAERDRPRLKTLRVGYLDTIGARLAAGRLLEDGDVGRGTPAVVVNRTIARRYFGNVSPVGSYMDWHLGGDQPVRVEIVGMIEDIRQALLTQEPYAEVFMDYRDVIAVLSRTDMRPANVDHLAFGFMSFALKTEGDPAHAIAGIRRVVTAVDANVGIDAAVPMTQLVAGSVARQRFYAVILGTLAVVAALLAAIGVYGLLSYAVVQRTREIGIRVALGARGDQVLGLILRRGMLLALLGIGGGLAAAAALTRYLQGLLYQITPLDPITFAAVALMFVVVAAIASYVPARRATAVDPMVVLRAE